MRALAALAVVGYHIGNYGGLERRHFGPALVLTAPLGDIGLYGVDLFFTISGFIMVKTAWDQFATPHASQRFFLHRVARIYPPYWLALLPILALYLVAPHLVDSQAAGPPDLLASFLLLPQRNEPLLLVSWSLVFEMEFYVLFALALNRPRRELWLFVGAWLASIIGLAALFPNSQNVYVDFFTSSFPLEFVFGMAAGALYASDRRIAPVAFLAFGIFTAVSAVALLGRHDVPGHSWFRGVLFGCSGAAIIYGAVGIERVYGRRVPAAIAIVGDASYAIYLWHVALLGAITGPIAHITPAGPIARVIALCLMFAATVAFGIAIYRYIERPMTRALNRRIAALWPSP